MSGAGGNFGAVLADGADERPDAPFLDTPGETGTTYGTIHELAARMAGALATAGAEPGDRVVAHIAKSPAAVALYLACLRGGFVHVPLNPAFTIDEVGDLARDADPAVLVADPTFVTDVAALAGVRVLLTLDSAGEGTFGSAASAEAPAPIVDRAGDDLAALLYTSGTTGRPKGAMLTHGNLHHNAVALHETWLFTPDDVLLHVLPIFHVHGLFVALHCAMLSTIPVAFLPRFDTGTALDLLPHSTVMMGVPTHYHRLLGDPRFDAATCSGMRLFTCGSAPLTKATFQDFETRTGHRICERYGMSETGIITSNPYDGERVAGTVGHPLPGVEIRVTVDDEPVPPDTTGVVEVRGANVGPGYWRRPEDSASTRRADGWFVTGDVGHVDAKGRLTLEGRAGDMIISGGENVYPKEVELLLDAVPGVVESAVIGVPHPDLGEAVTAIMVAEADVVPPSERIRTALGSLARYKHPRAICLVDALPRNAMGKVQKHELRRTWDTLFTGDGG